MQAAKPRTKSLSLHRKRNSEVLIGTQVGCGVKNGQYDVSKENEIPDFRPFVSSFYKSKPKFDYPPINYEEEYRDPWTTISADVLSKWAPKTINVPGYEKIFQAKLSLYQKSIPLKSDQSDTDGLNDSRDETPKNLKRNGSMIAVGSSGIKLENSQQNPKEKQISSLRKNLVRNLILDGKLNAKNMEIVHKIKNNKIDDQVLERIKKPILDKPFPGFVSARNFASNELPSIDVSEIVAEPVENKTYRKAETNTASINNILENKVSTPTILCKVSPEKDQLFIPIIENSNETVPSLNSTAILKNAYDSNTTRTMDRTKTYKSLKVLSPKVGGRNINFDEKMFQPKLVLKIRYMARRKSDVSLYSGGACKKLANIQDLLLDNEHKLIEIDNPDYVDPKLTEKTQENERAALRNKTLLLKKNTRNIETPKDDQVLNRAKAKKKTQIYDLKMPQDVPAILATFKATRIRMMTPLNPRSSAKSNLIKSDIKNDISEFFPGRTANINAFPMSAERETTPKNPEIDFFDLKLTKKKLDKMSDLNKRLKEGDLVDAYASMTSLNPRASHIFKLDKVEQKRLGPKVSYIPPVLHPKSASRIGLNSTKVGRSVSVSNFGDILPKSSPYEQPVILVKNDKNSSSNLKFAIFLKDDTREEDTRKDSARTTSKSTKVRTASTARAKRGEL